MVMTKVAIVILNYNGQAFLERFLPGVIQHSAECEIIVADNCSTDHSVAYVKDQFPTIRLLQLEENYGFSKGYNEALKQVEATYYVLLNSDVEVTENWVSPVVDFMEDHPQVAACQPKIKAFHNPNEFEYAGAAGGLIDLLGYPFCRGRLLQTIETDEGQYDDRSAIFWATGACLFVKAELFHQVGGFDSDYFAHMEEIDFCWRLKMAGYEIFYIPESTVLHVGGGTLPRESPRKTYLNFRNSLATLFKNEPLRRLWWKLPVRLALDAIAAIKFLLSDGWDNFIAVVRANVDFYLMLPKLYRKRQVARQFQHPVEPSYKGLLVWKYFIDGKRTYAEL
jgi:hypothetical protein